jgi:hypothetical protein
LGAALEVDGANVEKMDERVLPQRGVAGAASDGAHAQQVS